MIRINKRGSVAFGGKPNDDMYERGPRPTTALELRDFGEEANSRLPKWGTERGSDKGVEVAATYVMSNTNPSVLGDNTHTGVFIDGDDPVLWDPAGNYTHREIGSGRTLYGSEFSPEDYLRFQLTDGPDVTVRKFNTTPEQEAEIKKRIDDIGGGGFLTCTKNVTEAISGIGPFGEVEENWWPAKLDNQLRSLDKHVGEANDVQSLRHLLAKKNRLGASK
ncbi:MAG TPA: hypothetical protein VGO04_23405 [Ensifer sp.]|jgi:hypothetical protein|uniref:hypothetical protein n=1 Tax=Ensifer sp. TaxID=1872086 RepID=UPI002E0FF25E|nr:hypothetical protein [Ensifer sp.]